MASTSLTEVLRETLALFEISGEPRTTSEVADQFDLGRRSTYERLERLVEHGRLKTKKVGGNGRVWWRPPANDGDTSAWSAAAESLIDDVLERAEVGIFVLDDDFEVAWINDATERYFGIDREHVLGRDKRSLVDERISSVVADGGAFTETVLATYDDNTYTEQFECRVTPGPSREERWLEHRSEPIESGAYAGGRVELYYDVSDRTRLQWAHDHERTQFESIIEAVEEYAIFVLDPDGTVRTWNQGAERIKGYEAEEIVGAHFSRFYAEADRDAGVPAANLAAAAEDGSIEDEGWRLRADGSRFWATVTITALRDDDGELAGFVKVTRDMTERRETGRELRRERNLLEQVQEASPIGIGIYDTEGHLQRANQRYAALFDPSDGTGAESIEHRPALGADGSPIPSPARPVPQVISAGETVTDQRLRVDGPDGRTRWLSANAKPFQGPAEGDVDGVVVTTTDVTQLKTQADRLERQRDDLQRELQEMFERIDDAFVSLDSDLRFDYVNDRASELLERSWADLVGEHVWDAFEADADVAAVFEEAMTTQESVSFEGYYDALGRWFETHVYPSAEGLSVYFRDVSDRKERERELERYEQLVETVWDGVYALDENDRIVLVNDAFCDLVGYERDELVGSHARILSSEAVTDAATWLGTGVVADDGDVGILETALRTATGDTVPVETRFGPFEYEDGRVGRCGVTRDVTERKRFEETLLTLYESTRALVEAETAEAVDELVLEAAGDVIDLPGVAVYRYDADADELVPAAHAVEDGFFRGGSLPAVPPEDGSITGHAYASGDVHVFEDVRDSPYLQTDATELRGGLFVPLGDHGVLVAGSPEVGGIDDNSRRLVELLATTAEAAYQRVERETALREHERELQRQHESLAAINNLSAVVRDITDAVIEQSTREEIEATVCERLADSESYQFAWIGGVDAASQTVSLRTEAGVEGYLDGITVSVDPDDERSGGPTGRALRTGDPQVSQDIRSDSRHDPWRGHLDQYDVRSLAAIPIVHEETAYGVINIYADRPAAFDGRERAVIGQLGEVVGHAIAAAERKQALMSDEVTELEFTVSEFLDSTDRESTGDSTITLDRAVPTGDENFLYFGTAEGYSTENLASLGAQFAFFEDMTIVDRDGGAARFELRLSEPPVVSAVASNGGYLDQVVIADGALHMTIHLPPTVAARRIIDTVREAYPSAELLARQQITRSDDDLRRIQGSVIENLTERQQTALETAVYSGFFEWPRETSGEELAESLDVAPPTFHQHLRKAQRKAFESVFSVPS